MKRCSLSLAIRKVQIKIPLWHNCELIRIARIKNSINNGSKSSQGYRDSGSPKHWWGCKMVQPLWIRIWYLLKKTKWTLTMWPNNHTPGIYPREMKISIYTKPVHKCLQQLHSYSFWVENSPNSFHGGMIRQTMAQPYLSNKKEPLLIHGLNGFQRHYADSFPLCKGWNCGDGEEISGCKGYVTVPGRAWVWP